MGVKKRAKQLEAGESESSVVQSGKPPKKTQSVVYTFTEHYMWGLSWFADMYEKEGCLSSTGVPDSIAKVQSEETGQELNPLYALAQLRFTCLSRDAWDYEYKSARMLGSRCLGNQKMKDVLGMYVDPECKSLVKAIAYNLTFYKLKKTPKNTDKWDKCLKSEVDGMYYKRVEVTPLCSNKYDAYGVKRVDNAVWTTELPCDSELECPDGDGGVKKDKAAVVETTTILAALLCFVVLPGLLGCVFYSMTCHEVQKKVIRRDTAEDERLNNMTHAHAAHFERKKKEKDAKNKSS